MSLEICRPIEEHARLIMAWRNDPHTLNMSFHREPKVWDAFWPEFRDTYFAHPALPPMFVRADGERVAFLRFVPVSHPEQAGGAVVDISINVAPAARGCGHGRAALKQGSEHVQRCAGVDCVVAEIRVENEGSKRAFDAAGFRFFDETDKTVQDTGERCRIATYILDLTPRYWRAGGVKVIAEAGSNWRMGTPARDLAMGRKLIDIAVDAGADSVKFQTYRAETVYVENAGSSDYLSKSGIKQSIRDIFSDLAMPYEMVGELSAHCKESGIGFMSTPFSPDDFAAIDPHVEAHKIASYEISHAHLLRLAGGCGKPLVLSTGASTETDIAWAVDTYRAAGGRDLCLLQCTAKYPAPMDSMNLRAIPWLKARFGVTAGLSDHSRDPLAAPLAAVALGARVIEKHFTVDNRLPGPDHAFALTPDELKQMVAGIRAAEQTLGSGVKAVLGAETELAAYARRGVQAIRDIAKGEILREGDNIAVLRPGNQPLGVHPRFLETLEGRLAARAIATGEGLRPEDGEK
ncbi:MAG: GNAT family N-acetyltransferase [Rhodospirillales bacterium]|nr:GNAT family N-acetyltransferase [Rhodospirillales bacterium]